MEQLIRMFAAAQGLLSSASSYTDITVNRTRCFMSSEAARGFRCSRHLAKLHKTSCSDPSHIPQHSVLFSAPSVTMIDEQLFMSPRPKALSALLLSS
ncbi:hypothetical protein N656DRAFT_776219 [Canariomyces notabilis]|uniref:Uncharacterized protein n=1 Tax=Canariomyces notabilis TaxID=2074819 RepID=A0AAN6YV19_9PEZI|nr:hypothetical protein N656DRAFT_776219 [Canariomyces arenarius]